MSGTAHFIWFILTILTGFIALPLWIICAICMGSSRNKKRDNQLEEQNKLLKQIAEQNKWRNYRD